MIHGLKSAFCPLAAALLAFSSVAYTVDTAEIEAVRKKEVLDVADTQVIDNFVAQAIKELAASTDFTTISAKRTFILSHSSSLTTSAEVQYKEQFLTSAAKYIEAALEEAKGLEPGKKDKIRLNLMILLDNLQDKRLIKIAVKTLDDANAGVRYWSVHSVSNPVIIKKLNPTGEADAELIQAAADKLKDRIDKENSPQIMSLIIDFAGNINNPAARDLLIKIADVRIKKYESWTVDYELLDEKVLSFLCDNIAAGSPNKAALSQRFVQLCSYAMQRYIKGMDKKDLLTETQKQQLASTLTDVEQKCISKLLAMSQAAIKAAIEKENSSSLSAEYNSLFGGENQTGRLMQALNLDTPPRALSNPPEGGK